MTDNRITQGHAIAQSQAQDQARSIPYRPQYNLITGKVTASILLQQISYWWHTCERKPFYKFRAPCQHEKCRKGDSWTEELGMTIYEFDGALKKIAAKVIKGANKTELAKTNLVVYWTDSDRITWYQLNEALFYLAIYYAYNDPQALADTSLADLPGKQEKSTKLSKQEKPVYIPSETTTEITTDIIGKSSKTEKAGPLTLILETKTAQDKLKYPIEYLSGITAQLLGLRKVPNHKFEANWESPLADLLDQVDGDVDCVEAALRAAAQEGRDNGMTMTTPSSLHGLALKALASDNGAESYDEILTRQEANEERIRREIARIREAEHD